MNVRRYVRVTGHDTSLAGMWLPFCAIVVLAALLRLVLFTGFFGSDEISYVEAAQATLRGTWGRSTYIGSLRAGVNFPIAAAFAMFGTSPAAAAAWGFACSLVEVMAVFWIGWRLAGLPLALAGSAILACLPLHVHLAGRIMADPPLGMFVTLTFVMLLEASRRQSVSFYALAGAFAGCVFWIKEAVTIFVAVAVLGAALLGTRRSGWIAAAAAMATVCLANFFLMWSATGNAWHLMDALAASMRRYADPVMLSSITDDRSATFYLRYLFLNVWHTWILGPLALVGALAAFRRARAHEVSFAFLLAWGLGLLVVFSLVPVSLTPFRLIPKQTNYMAIFFAPLALLAGLAVVQLRNNTVRASVVTVYMLGAIALSALEQQTIDAFTANSRVTPRWAKAHPHESVYVTTNAERYNLWLALLRPSRETPAGNIHPLASLFPSKGKGQEPADLPLPNQSVYAILDPATLSWGENGIRSLSDVPPCWIRTDALPRTPDSSVAASITGSLAALVKNMPIAPAKNVAAKLHALLVAPEALVYRVPPACR